MKRKMMINKERIKNIFETLVKIDSPSGEEAEVAKWLKTYLLDLGCELREDNAAEILGTNANNIIAEFKGNSEKEPFLLCGHMDTVEPGRGVEPVFEDGIFKSKGDTVLGSDDKSALAIILEVLHVFKENNIEHAPIEMVFTVFEEGGLKGAKVFDINSIKSKLGYILDSSTTRSMIVSAPACVQMKFTIKGETAHAGVEPEKGVNAIIVASHALSKVNSGRIDDETTCNIGIIKGGHGTNIVPDKAVIYAEARSHKMEKLEAVVDDVKKVFTDTIEEFQNKLKRSDCPEVTIEIEEEFSHISLSDDEEIVKLSDLASESLGFKLNKMAAGGGSDANVFFKKGLKVGVLGTGMTAVHTTDEHISLQDMVECAEFVLEAIKIYSK